MNPLWACAVILTICLSIAGFMFWQGGRSAELDRAKDTIKTQERVNEALADCAGRHWSERLLNDCD